MKVHGSQVGLTSYKDDFIPVINQHYKLPVEVWADFMKNNSHEIGMRRGQNNGSRADGKM